MLFPYRAKILSLVVIVLVSFAQWTIANERVPRNMNAISDVEAGRVETARASWWGFDPADATKSMQAAMNCRAKRIVVEDMGQPWIVTTIHLPSEKEIIFEPGTIVEAKRGAFRGKGDCLFQARGCENLTVRGTGATFRMHKSDYHKPPYELAEWRHTLSIRGCENMLIEGLSLSESGGDGIYLGAGPDGATNSNVTIRNVVCDGNNRQGISVITAENLLIEDCVFRNTQGTAPQSGIDFEPNHSEERLVNCVLRNCCSENNAGHAYHIYLGYMNEQSPPVSIRFENCTSRGCQRYSTSVGVANRDGGHTVRGKIEYVGCRFEADVLAGVYIRGNEADGCRVRFADCEVIRRDEKETRLAPITIEAPKRPDLDVGNIEISNCIIQDTLVRQPIALIASPMTGLRNVTGSLTVKSPGKEHSYTLDAAQLDEWFPSQGLAARIPRFAFDWKKARLTVTDVSAANKGTTFRLRGDATWLVWGEADRPIKFAARLEPVGRHTPTTGVMSLTTPDGETTKLSPKVEGEQHVYCLTQPKTGPHRLHWQGDSKTTIRLVQCSAPVAILGGPLGINLFQPSGTLYFPVPDGVQRFALQITGQGTAETVKAIVRDASGRVVDQEDSISTPRVFIMERNKAARMEIWSVTLDRASKGVLEDVSIQTLGVPPIFSTMPGEAFVPSLLE
ncbi:MAG: right-handed parallel beta-helix repeat-containing protein [Sedimentisphaerales bacterium]|nr:right-handed parallel beta-helix repeat-containing protein [Sedimentisphaerales bacterium]